MKTMKKSELKDTIRNNLKNLNDYYEKLLTSNISKSTLENLCIVSEMQMIGILGILDNDKANEYCKETLKNLEL